jgi:phosphatidylglycerophosphate synthase
LKIANIYVLKPYKDAGLKALALWLKARRISANMITAVGLIFGLGAAVCILRHLNLYGVGLLGLSIGADVLDGTVARLENVEKVSGKVFDAVCDRLVEIAWIGALVLTGMIQLWALSLAFGSIMLLICRLWAYRRKMDTSFVIFTRFERMVALLSIVILPWRDPALVIYIVVTIGTFFSSFQIIRMIFKFRSKIEKYLC